MVLDAAPYAASGFCSFFLGGGKKGGPGRHPFAGVLGGLRTKVWPDVRQYLWPLSDSGG